MYKYNIGIIPDIINSFYVTNGFVHSFNTRNGIKFDPQLVDINFYLMKCGKQTYIIIN